MSLGECSVESYGVRLFQYSVSTIGSCPAPYNRRFVTGFGVLRSYFVLSSRRVTAAPAPPPAPHHSRGARPGRRRDGVPATAPPCTPQHDTRRRAPRHTKPSERSRTVNGPPRPATRRAQRRGGSRREPPTARHRIPLPPVPGTRYARTHVRPTAALGRRAHSHRVDAHTSAPGATSNHSHTQTQIPDETPRWRVQRHDRKAAVSGPSGPL